MEVPVLPDVSKEDFLSIVQWIRNIVENAQTPDNLRLDFLRLNFPQIEDVDELSDKLFEDISLDGLVNFAFLHG